MASLEVDAGMEKSASVTPQVKPNISQELEGLLTKAAEVDMTKSAFAQGEALAKELLQKLAAENEIQIGDAVMEAQDATKVVPTSCGTIDQSMAETVAQAAARGASSEDVMDKLEDGEKRAMENRKLARNIMSKVAQMVGEPTTTPAAEANVAGAVAPNMIQLDNAGMTAQDDVKVVPMPGTEGTINNILQSIVAQAQAQGAGSENIVDGPAAPEGGGAHLGTIEDEQEKAAAVSALTAEGLDFDTAISLVKQAEVDLNEEAEMQEKMAAVNALIGQGVDFDSAVELVKEAEYLLEVEADELEKVAAVNYLIGGGYDFDTAVELVKEAKASGKLDRGVTGSMSEAEARYFEKQHGNSDNKMYHTSDGKPPKGPGPLSAEQQAALRAKNEAEKSKGSNGILTKVKNHFREGYNDLGHQFAGLGVKGQRWNMAKALAKNPVVQAGAAGTAALSAAGAYAVHKHHQKKAAFDMMINDGVDFDIAVELVKEASEEESTYEKSKKYLSGKYEGAKDYARKTWEAAREDAAIARHSAKGAVMGGRDVKASRLAHLKSLWGTRTGKVGAGVAGAAALGGAGYAAYRHHEKKSALEALIGEGIDFDTAVDLVKQAEYEVYGE